MGDDREGDEGERWLSLMLWTPKLFSSVRKKVSPGPPAAAADVRVPGEGDRDWDELRTEDLGRVDEEAGGEANMSSTGRITEAVFGWDEDADEGDGDGGG